MRDLQKYLNIMKALHYRAQQGYISISDIGKAVVLICSLHSIMYMAWDDQNTSPFANSLKVSSHMHDDLTNHVSGDKTLRQFWGMVQFISTSSNAYDGFVGMYQENPRKVACDSFLTKTESNLGIWHIACHGYTPGKDIYRNWSY